MKIQNILCGLLTFIVIGSLVQTPFLSTHTPIDENINFYRDSSSSTNDGKIFKSYSSVGEDPIKTDVTINGDFDIVNPTTYGPQDWNFYGSHYKLNNGSYQDLTNTGSYSGYIEAKGDIQANSNNYLSTHIFSGDDLYLSEAYYLKSYYYVRDTAEIVSNTYSYIHLYITNGTTFNLNYIVSYGAGTAFSNSTGGSYRNGNILLNSSLETWHLLDRNVTADFEAVFGSVSSNLIFAYYYAHVNSPRDASEPSQMIIDDISLKNTTNIEIMSNGDFESGDGDYWSSNYAGVGLAMCDETNSLEGKSLNMTTVSYHSGYSSFINVYDYLYQYSRPRQGFYASEPDMLILDFDWFYSDVYNGGNSQQAYLQLGLINQTHTLDVNWVLGRNMNDTSFYINDTTGPDFDYDLIAPAFGTRDQWVHFQYDLYDFLSPNNLTEMELNEIRFITRSGENVNSTTQLFVDNLEISSYAFGDPGFENNFYDIDYSEPIPSWSSLENEDYTNLSSSIKHSGDYSLNITANQANGLSECIRTVSLDIEENMYTDFWWYLDHLVGSSNSEVFIRMDFNNSDYILYYILGYSDDISYSNSSNLLYIYADNYNQTGEWFNLVRNIEEDLDNYFGENSWYMNRIDLVARGQDPEALTKIFFDDLHFIRDTTSPEITAVNIVNTPKYYTEAEVHISTHDLLGGTDTVLLYYRTDADWIIVTTSYIGGEYICTIPTGPALAITEFYIVANDTFGQTTLDDNLGSYYVYSHLDDISPSVSIVTPINESTVKDTIELTIDCSDSGGSGINRVEIFDNGSLLYNDTIAPYSFEWNTRTVENGTHVITFVCIDNAGNEESESIIVETANDFTIPSVSDIHLNPTVPQYDEEVTVLFAVQDQSQIQNATLYYKIGNNSWNQVLMTSEANLFSGIIPSANWNVQISYCIDIYDVYEQKTSVGSQETPLTYSVSDNIKPEMNIDAPSRAQTLRGNEIEFGINGSDEGSKISHLEVNIDRANITWTEDQIPCLFKLNTSELENGNYTIIFTLFDNAGNSVSQDYAYQIENPQGFFARTWDTIDSFLETWGLPVGAGIGAIGIGTGYLVRWRVKTKKIKNTSSESNSTSGSQKKTSSKPKNKKQSKNKR